MNTSFQSPTEKKDISKNNNAAYYESDDQVYTVSNSKEQVYPSSDPRVDTHITDGI